MTQPTRTNRFADEMRLAATLTPAVPKVAPVSRTTATADSSGFVDLSDFSETDGDWVDRALAQSRNGGRPVVPPSIAPVAIESLAPPVEKRVKSKAPLGAIVFVAACVAVAAAGVASAVVVVRERKEKPATATAQIAAMTIEPPALAPDPSASAPPADAVPAPSDSAPSTIAARPTKKSPKKPAWGGGHTQPSPASAPPPVAAARRPAAGGGGGGGSLDDLIRRAAQSKGGH